MMGRSDSQLFAALPRAAEWRVSNFNVQNLANAAWAFATASQFAPQLFAALARAVEWRMSNFNMQGLANTALLERLLV